MGILKPWWMWRACGLFRGHQRVEPWQIHSALCLGGLGDELEIRWVTDPQGVEGSSVSIGVLHADAMAATL